MSMKRQATNKLDHENWDQDEPKDHDMSTFKTAAKDVLEKRVIKTGKRRFYAPSGDDTRKNVFSGFQGFKKPEPTSFEFLTNLTNGTKTTSNGSILTSTDSIFASSSPFGLKVPSSSSSFQIPTIPVTCEASAKPTNIFGPAIKSSVFQTPSNTTSPNAGSIFNSPKGELTPESSFKIPSTGNTMMTNNFLTPTKSDASTVSNKTNIQYTPPIFGTASINQSMTPTTSSSISKSILNNSGSNPFKKTENIVPDLTSTDIPTKDKNLAIFYSKLASLNKAVTEWVRKHVEDTPLCILTPIFRDYEKYLRELQNKYGTENIENELESESQSKITDPEVKTSKTFEYSSKPFASSLFANHSNKNTGNNSLFDTKCDANISKDKAALVGPKSTDVTKTISTNVPSISFGTTNVKTIPTFSFGVNDSILNTSTTNDTTVTFTHFTKSTTTVSAPTTATFSFNNNSNNPTTTTVNPTMPTLAFGRKPNSTDSVPTFSFGIPSSAKANDSNTNTLFTIANKQPIASSNMSASTFSFAIPTSNSTVTTASSTFAFNSKPLTLGSPPTLYSTGSATGTTTSVPSTFSFNSTTTTPAPSTFSFNSATTTPAPSTFSFNSATTTPAPSTFSYSTKSTGATSISPFTINMTSSPLSATTASSTFSFAIRSQPQDQSTTTGSSFNFNMNAPVNTVAESKPFSFGLGKPFTFNTENKTESSEQAEKEEDEPSKIEFTPLVEENSVYDKRCKIYVKKDGSFVDKGIGTLYIKKVDDNEKHQLLVRANTNLGNILINLILSKSIPLQRMGKNDVMMGCIPTPDEKPPPIPVLIRVKTSEEADELLEILNKYT